MCNFKSGIILKNKVVLAPEGRESHSDLLDSLNIDDNHMNASKVFVRAELTPPDGNKAVPIVEWNYRVDQDITPDWYDIDPGRYEKEMREAVAEYMKDRLKNVICGYDWTPIKDGQRTYYFMNGILFKSRFGKSNNYADSYILNELENHKLTMDLRNKFGNMLVSITTDLTSMDGFKDYGQVEGKTLSIPTIDLIMKFGEYIPLIDEPYWLATPNQTPSRRDPSCVQCVCYGGRMDYVGCSWGGWGVRPFFILQS